MSDTHKSLSFVISNILSRKLVSETTHCLQLWTSPVSTLQNILRHLIALLSPQCWPLLCERLYYNTVRLDELFRVDDPWHASELIIVFQRRFINIPFNPSLNFELRLSLSSVMLLLIFMTNFTVYSSVYCGHSLLKALIIFLTFIGSPSISQPLTPFRFLRSNKFDFVLVLLQNDVNVKFNFGRLSLLVR